MASSVFTPEQEQRINELLVDYLAQNCANIDTGVNVTELTGDALTDENADDPTEDSDDLFVDEEDSELELMTSYSRDDLELMDAEERAAILEDAGYEPDDFGFDDF